MSSADSFVPIASRPAPMAQFGPLAWLRRSFFDGWANALLTLAVIALLVLAMPPLLEWALWQAVARPDNAACRAAHGTGACWGVVAEKVRLSRVVLYPDEEQGRSRRACSASAWGC